MECLCAARWHFNIWITAFVLPLFPRNAKEALVNESLDSKQVLQLCLYVITVSWPSPVTLDSSDHVVFSGQQSQGTKTRLNVETFCGIVQLQSFCCILIADILIHILVCLEITNGSYDKLCVSKGCSDKHGPSCKKLTPYNVFLLQVSQFFL